MGSRTLRRPESKKERGSRMSFRIGPADEGRTLQSVLRDRLACSHAGARGLIDAGTVRGRPAVRPGDYARRVVAGERFEVIHDPERRYRPGPRPRPGRGYLVIHQDRSLLIANLVGLPGFEPGTSRLSGARSNQLSYRPSIGQLVYRSIGLWVN